MFRRVWMLIALTALLSGVLPVGAQGDGLLAYSPDACAGDITGAPLSEACQKMIVAFPAPTWKRIPQDGYTLGFYNFWKVGPSATPTFDGPNGNVIGEIPAGFNYVNIVDQSVEGWLKSQDGRWIRQQDATPASPSYFTGVELDETFTHPFAFILDKSHIFVSSVPGGPADKKTGRFLKRYELVNIFAVATDKEGWRWYMIGPNQWVKQTFVGKVQRIKPPEGVTGRWVAIDLYEQVLVAYEDDKPMFATLVSTGTAKYETQEGLFKVWARLERDGMSGATGAPSAYALQSVPWVMYFDGGRSLHGTYWHDLFGYRTSHGCVNMSISDSRWLYYFLKEAPPNKDGEIVNPVYVYSTGVYGDSVVRGQ